MNALLGHFKGGGGGGGGDLKLLIDYQVVADNFICNLIFGILVIKVSINYLISCHLISYQTTTLPIIITYFISDIAEIKPIVMYTNVFFSGKKKT